MEQSQRLEILVVDDELAVCRALKRLLSGVADVDIATGALQALNMLSNRTYDVIICDFNMPQITGGELYRRLAEEKPGTEESLIFLTGGVLSSEHDRFLREVDTPVIYKPFEREKLMEVIEAVS